MNTINDVINSIDEFSIDDKLELADIIRKQAIEQRRLEIKKNSVEALEEFHSKQIKPESVEDFFRRI
jgi:hypothetical protein